MPLVMARAMMSAATPAATPAMEMTVTTPTTACRRLALRYRDATYSSKSIEFILRWYIGYPHPYFGRKVVVFLRLQTGLRCKIVKTKEFPAKSSRIRSYGPFRPLVATFAWSPWSPNARDHHPTDEDLSVGIPDQGHL